MRPSIFDPYDPLLGIGSHIERKDFKCECGTIVRLPIYMFNDPKISSLLRAFEGRLSLDELNRLRMPYDAEYSLSKIPIQNKAKQTVFFVANYAQRMILADLEAQRFQKKRIQQDDPKGRQLGITTLHELYSIFLSFYVRQDQNTSILIASLQNDAGSYHKEIIENMIVKSGLAKGLKSHGNAKSIYEVVWHDHQKDSRTILFVFGTSNNPEGKSGFTIDYAIIDEVGKMKTTEKINAKDFVTNLTSTVPRQENCGLILLGTSKQMQNNYWQERINRGIKGQSNSTIIFTGAQHDIAQYKHFENEEEKAAFMDRVFKGDFVGYVDNFYLKKLHDKGELPEFLYWYDSVLRDLDGHQVMMQENPTSIDEMFVRVEGRYFKPEHTEALKQECREPLGLYRITSFYDNKDDTDISVGMERIKRSVIDRHIDFGKVETTPPLIKIWKQPHTYYDYVLDEIPIGLNEIPFERLSGGRIGLKHGYKMLRRFVLTSDPSKGKSEESSNGCGVVFDTLPLLYNRPVEVVAEWHGRVPITEFGWEQARLGYFYDKSFWVIERNLMDSYVDPSESNGEDGSNYLIKSVAVPYRKLGGRVYTPKDEDGTAYGAGKKSKIGFWTSKSSRPLALQALETAIEEVSLRLDGKEATGYVERNIDAVFEMENVVTHDDGKVKAAFGYRDDRVMARAIGLYVIGERRKVKKTCKIVYIGDTADEEV